MSLRTVVETLYDQGSIVRLKLACVTNSSDGLFADYTIKNKVEGSLVQLVTNPGATAPDANYDVTIKNQDGVDMLFNVGANRHTSNSEIALIVSSGTSAHPVVKFNDVLTLGIADTTANSAITELNLYMRRA